MMNWPVTSTVGVSAGTGVELAGPTAAMRPARMTTVALGIGARAVPSMTVAPTSA